MIKELQYKGYATEPSDYECPDGQLATSLNLINEDSQLKPVFQPSELAELPSGYKVVYIHDTNTFTHYILLNTGTNKLYWIDESIITDAAVKPVSSTTIETELAQTYPSRELYSFGSLQIYNVNGIGNTLIVLTSSGMHYLLWKGDTEGYLYLGTHLPELPISFGLQGETVISEKFKPINKDYSLPSTLNDEDSINFTNAILGQVNKFVVEKGAEEGRFIFPFLVRYAYRLYDGSLTMHSSPVLMLSNAGQCAPFVYWIAQLGGAGRTILYKDTEARIIAHSNSLDYCVLGNINALSDWKDIVRSVDIFISAPFYSYDQAGMLDRLVGVNSSIYSVNALSNKPIGDKLYTVNSVSRYSQDDYSAPIPLPEKDITESIRLCSSFYLFKSIKIDNLKSTRTVINVEKDYLKSLVARETMSDDYNSHDDIVPKYAFAFNNRLNLANISSNISYQQSPLSLFCYTNDDGNGNITSSRAKIVAEIQKEGKKIIVSSDYNAFPVNVDKVAPITYVYNPDGYTRKIYLVYDDETKYEFSMNHHEMLNGSVRFAGINPLLNRYGDIIGFGEPLTIASDVPVPTTDNTISLYNKIYTSEVNNPFHFPVLGINTVGIGTILGISAAAKALSQGQFGQFPLYAFTTEGVWALEVSSTGSYSARQPITRDVCINTDSITQIDSSVLFATDRGIMLISGSQTQCITDSIFSEAPFNVLDLPGIDQLHAKLGHSADACLPMQPFLGFLAGCQMVYDYVHQRIFVYNPTKVNGTPKYTYAYVFSLKSKMWGMVFTNLASTINAYPEALAMTLDNKLVSFSETDEEVCKGLYITRPLKLEAADVHKTISALIQRGHFQRGDVGTVLYGSRDLFTWHLVWSSKDHYLRGFRGTPYKYFRIAGLATLTDGKSIFGASVNFEPRHTNQLR